MQKILLIGQAPAAVNQTVPYDSTLLYDMLLWARVSKERAQEIFDFEAVSNKFPGFDEKGGHNKPSMRDCDIHWNKTLGNKVDMADKIILLGRVAADYFKSKPKTWGCNTIIIEMIHPSKRNYSKIMANKEQITKQLLEVING